MVVGDGGGDVQKCILGVGGVGSVVWWMWCGGCKKSVFYVCVRLGVWCGGGGVKMCILGVGWVGVWRYLRYSN